MSQIKSYQTSVLQCYKKKKETWDHFQNSKIKIFQFLKEEKRKNDKPWKKEKRGDK